MLIDKKQGAGRFGAGRNTSNVQLCLLINDFLSHVYPENRSGQAQLRVLGKDAKAQRKTQRIKILFRSYLSNCLECSLNH